MESSNILQLYRVIVKYPDGFIRNMFCFEDRNDAIFITNILQNHYKYMYSYRPMVILLFNSCIVYHANDLIFIDGKEYTLSTVDIKMSELKRQIDNNKDNLNHILGLLGEQSLIPQPKNGTCECFLCLLVYIWPCLGMRNLDNPTHFKYSIYTNIKL